MAFAGGTPSSDIDECILLASNEGRLRFVDALFNAIICGQSEIPAEIALGGLTAIVNPYVTELPYSLFAEDVCVSLRFSVLAKMGVVFTEIFPRRCEPLIACHATASQNPWNSLCFMWWDVLPRHGVPAEAFLAEVDLAILELMGAVLAVDHIACKEAALHGLGHWQVAYPDEVENVIDRHYAAIPDVLRGYALAAKSGNVQ